MEHAIGCRIFTTGVDKATESYYKNYSANANIEVIKEEDGDLFSAKQISSFSLKKGESKNISYYVNNQFVNESLLASGMKYTVSSPSVCSISTSGKVTGKKAGKTKITITPKEAPSFAQTITVTVKETKTKGR